jgi:anti-sigma factor RsiW
MTNNECKDVFARLSEYLDQELPDDVCRQFDAHIGSCSPCVEFVESLKKSIALSRQFQLGQQPRPLQEGEREQLLEAYQRLRQSLQR